MQYISTRGRAPRTSLKEAVIQGLADDQGLFVPERIPILDKERIHQLSILSNQSIAKMMLEPFAGEELGAPALKKIIEDTFVFDLPLKQLEENIWSLELFHGPTLAFKDVGARFLARLLNFFMPDDRKLTVIVATSGDTGSAVASGFSGMDSVDVILLYPSGKVSTIQEKQLTTAGKNVTALEVLGDFDDCQRLVKKAFADHALRNEVPLTSANSINIARWLPQSVYYAIGLAQLPMNGRTVVSVPSGNYGNITAGILAQKMGIPIHHFVAASNQNDTIPEYLSTGIYRPRPSRQTLSNAMDVGNPSNFERLIHLFNNNFKQLKANVSGYAFSDDNTLQAILEGHKKFGYMFDPHGAIGYLGLRKFLGKPNNQHLQGIILETAHPAKFHQTVKRAINQSVEMPANLQNCLKKEGYSVRIKPDYHSFKDFLLNL